MRIIITIRARNGYEQSRVSVSGNLSRVGERVMDMEYLDGMACWLHVFRA